MSRSLLRAALSAGSQPRVIHHCRYLRASRLCDRPSQGLTLFLPQRRASYPSTARHIPDFFRLASTRQALFPLLARCDHPHALWRRHRFFGGHTDDPPSVSFFFVLAPIGARPVGLAQTKQFRLHAVRQVQLPAGKAIPPAPRVSLHQESLSRAPARRAAPAPAGLPPMPQRLSGPRGMMTIEEQEVGSMTCSTIGKQPVPRSRCS